MRNIINLSQIKPGISCPHAFEKGYMVAIQCRSHAACNGFFEGDSTDTGSEQLGGGVDCMNGDFAADVEPTKSDGGSIQPSTDWGGSLTPSISLIEELSEMTDRDPLTMPPLYDSIDTDALDSLLSNASTNGHPTVTVSFEYDGYSISIESSGNITIE